MSLAPGETHRAFSPWDVSANNQTNWEHINHPKYNQAQWERTGVSECSRRGGLGQIPGRKHSTSFVYQVCVGGWWHHTESHTWYYKKKSVCVRLTFFWAKYSNDRDKKNDNDNGNAFANANATQAVTATDRLVCILTAIITMVTTWKSVRKMINFMFSCRLVSPIFHFLLLLLRVRGGWSISQNALGHRFNIYIYKSSTQSTEV